MDGMDSIFLGGGGALKADDEFMVVPTLVEETLPTSHQLDEFLLESNFAGVTGTILSPPSNHAHDFCTIGEGGRQSDVPSVQLFNFDQHYQESFVQQPLFDGEFNFLDPTPAAAVVSDGQAAAQYFDVNFDFTGGQGGIEPVRGENAAVTEETIWQGVEEEPQQFSLDDPNSSWLDQYSGLSFVEKMTSENEQQCRLLEELLRDDTVFRDVEASNDGGGTSREEDSNISDEASEILNEIYREAQQLDFSNVSGGDVVEETDDSWTVSSMETVVVNAVQSQRPVAPKISKASIPVPQYHLADHDFGSAKRGRPPGSSKKRHTLKRDLKVKKQYQNREAALRYRLKKRAEKMEKEGEMEQLLKRNQFLKNEKYSLTAEVKYLKDLLVEIRKLKGYQ